MQLEKSTHIVQDRLTWMSGHLGRFVQVDLYFSEGYATSAGFLPEGTTLLLINDGQDLEKMGLQEILSDLCGRGMLGPLLCAGIHAGPDRMMEYGTAGIPDFSGRGAQAEAYSRCVLEEVIPAIRGRFGISGFAEKAFAGFSLGALSALDIVWRHPQEFARVGLFSGSFWWRSRDKADPAYDERTDRIMQRRVGEGGYYPWLKFFFECGTEDEQEDRNGNGIIDSIDDTHDLIHALVVNGYQLERDIRYVEIAGGRHDVDTWARAMPEFLLWGWGNK